MEKQALAYLAKGLSFYDTSIKLGITPQEVIAMYAQHRANPK